MKRSNLSGGKGPGAWCVLSATAVMGLLCGLAPVAGAQEAAKPAAASQPAEKLPEAKEIHAKFIKALGGEEAIKGLKTRVSKANIDIPAQGMKATVTSYQSTGSIYVMMDLANVGQMETGLTEGVAWQRSLMTGPQVMDGGEREQLVREADLQNEINVDKYFTKMETVGTGEVDGKKCYKVEFTPTTGEKQTRYYEVESGLLVKIESMQQMQGNPIPVTATMSDYRDVDGVKAPFKMTQSMMQISSTITYEMIAYNKDVPAEKLKTPDEIKAVVEKKKAADAGKTEAPKTPEAPKAPEAPKKPDAPKR